MEGRLTTDTSKIAALAAVRDRLGGPLFVAVVGLVAFWLLVLVVLPQAALLHASFRPDLPPRRLGGPEDVYTLANYLRLAETPRHLWILLRTVTASLGITAIVLAIGYPLAWILAKRLTPAKAMFILLLMALPLGISDLLRNYAWFGLLAYKGVINELLIGLGLIADDARLDMLGGTFALVCAMTYGYLLLMVLPIWSALDTLEDEQIDAARDLGAPMWQVHHRIALPHARAGIGYGCALTFLSAVGSYAAPAVLGGGRTVWFTEVIYDIFLGSEGGDWNRGAAYAFSLLAVGIVVTLVGLRLIRVGPAELPR